MEFDRPTRFWNASNDVPVSYDRVTYTQFYDRVGRLVSNLDRWGTIVRTAYNAIPPFANNIEEEVEIAINTVVRTIRSRESFQSELARRRVTQVARSPPERFLDSA